MTDRLHAVVAGAGIGGLTAAIALSRAGHRVTVLERAPVIEEVGAGLQLGPNATCILAELGLLERIQKLALAPEALRIRSARNGLDIARLPLGPIAEMRWGAPYVVIHRADLQRSLLEACAQDTDIRVETGMPVAGFAVTEAGVEIGVKRGEDHHRFEADFLIGADGLRSIVRERIGLGMGDRPVWSGRTAWRAVLPAASAPSHALRFETSLWLGQRAHLVHYPLRQGEVVNVVAITEDGWRADEAPDLWSIPGDARQVAPSFSRWHRDARDLIGAVKEWRRWPLFDRNPVARWTIDRVALLGDAAHPMLPFYAQGAAQAVEDAGALLHAFGKHGRDVTKTLTAYQAARASRAGSVVIASRRQGAIYHLGGAAAFVRDLTMRSLGPNRMLARLDWLYGYRGA
jgi:salicylate hydroxylase